MHCPFKCSFTRVCRFTINNNEEWYKVKLKCPSTLMRATKVVITNLQLSIKEQNLCNVIVTCYLLMLHLSAISIVGKHL